MTVPWLVVLGVAAGICSGVFGIGGGVVIVPALVLGMGYSQHAANGTSLVALLLPVGMFGAWAYYRAGKIGPDQIKAGLLVAIGMFLGAYLGAKLAVALPQQTLRRIFALFLVAVAARLWILK